MRKRQRKKVSKAKVSNKECKEKKIIKRGERKKEKSREIKRNRERGLKWKREKRDLIGARKIVFRKSIVPGNL